MVNKEIDLFNSGIGDKLTLSTSQGEKIDTEGSLVSGNVSSVNGKPEGAGVTLLDIVNLGVHDDLSLEVGVNAGPLEMHVGAGLGNGLGQVSIGGRYEQNGKVTSVDLKAKPGLGSLALAWAAAKAFFPEFRIFPL